MEIEDKNQENILHSIHEVPPKVDNSPIMKSESRKSEEATIYSTSSDDIQDQTIANLQIIPVNLDTRAQEIHKISDDVVEIKFGLCPYPSPEPFESQNVKEQEAKSPNTSLQRILTEKSLLAEKVFGKVHEQRDILIESIRKKGVLFKNFYEKIKIFDEKGTNKEGSVSNMDLKSTNKVSEDTIAHDQPGTSDDIKQDQVENIESSPPNLLRLKSRYEFGVPMAYNVLNCSSGEMKSDSKYENELQSTSNFQSLKSLEITIENQELSTVEESKLMDQSVDVERTNSKSVEISTSVDEVQLSEDNTVLSKDQPQTSGNKKDPIVGPTRRNLLRLESRYTFCIPLVYNMLNYTDSTGEVQADLKCGKNVTSDELIKYFKVSATEPLKKLKKSFDKHILKREEEPELLDKSPRTTFLKKEPKP